MEILFELLAETVLQMVAEILIDLGIHPAGTNAKPRAWPVFAGYAVSGILIGGISLLVLPEHFIRSEILQTANLLLTPVLAGGMVCSIDTLRKVCSIDTLRKRQSQYSRCFRFACGFAFAFCMALVRLWAQAPA